MPEHSKGRQTSRSVDELEVKRHCVEVNHFTSKSAGRAVAGFEYIFPSIRGVQAGREYYISMCPMRLIPRIFLFDEEELKPELRAQRSLNRQRVPEIARYILSNPNGYTFSALTASVDGKVKFEPLGRVGNALLRKPERGWNAALKKLSSLDWSRENSHQWEGRAMNAGRLSKRNVNVTLTGNLIKQHLGLPLTAEEQQLEADFKRRKR